MARRVARAYGIPTGGAMPKGFLTEDGPRPEFAALYGAVGLPTESYPARTVANVRDTDAILWFGDYHSHGGRATLDACRELRKPFLIVYPGTRPSTIREWLDVKRDRILIVAGNRRSIAPDIEGRVE